MKTELRIEVTDRSGTRTGVPRLHTFLDGPICLGRSKRNDVVFGDTRVSRVHLVIDRDENGWRITRKGRLEKTVLNADPMQEGDRRPLADGDVLEVGPCRFQFQVVEVGAPTEALGSIVVPRPPDAAAAAGARSMESTDPLW
jgi:pSer/pThr/pTyr-binding forkhead associated (FHA) protein